MSRRESGGRQGREVGAGWALWCFAKGGGSLGELRAGELLVWILVWRSCLWPWAVRGQGGGR